jgi:hypothetical protein
MWKKKMLNEGNQIHNFKSSSGSGTVINYASGSDFLTVPVTQGKKLRFLRFRFRFRFHNTAESISCPLLMGKRKREPLSWVYEDFFVILHKL